MLDEALALDAPAGDALLAELRSGVLLCQLGNSLCKMSEAPAAIVGLPDQGRPLEVGEPANLTVIDPSATWTVHGPALASRSDNTPYEAMELPATVTATLLRGTVTARDGKAGA